MMKIPWSQSTSPMASKELAPAACCFPSSFASSRERVCSCRPLLVRACSSTVSTRFDLATNRLSRRSLLVQLVSSPLFLRTEECHPSTAEDSMDPAEQALVETLDARDSLAEIFKDIKSITQSSVLNADLQNPRRAIGEIYESLETSLPKVAEQFELEDNIVQELLESVACAHDVFMRSSFTTNPASGLYNCSKFLQLACVQMDEMLEQVPSKTLEAIQLLRGVRPGA